MLDNEDKALHDQAVDFAGTHGTNSEVAIILVALIKERAIENAGHKIAEALNYIARCTVLVDNKHIIALYETKQEYY